MSIAQIRHLDIKTLLLGALSITVAYAWSNAVNSLIDQYAPADQSKKNAWYKVFYACVLTIVAAIVIRLSDFVGKK